MEIMHVDIQEAGYEKDVATIHNVRFSIEPAQLVGMVGANGAGKSTTIKAMLDQLVYVKGQIQKDHQMTYSYIPERPVYYDELTLWEHIEFVAAVEGLGEQQIDYARDLLRTFRLYTHRHEFPHSFSKGMQQKGMITLALFSQPEFLIIDEPFMGLDPSSTKILLELLEKEKEKGTAILMCTHVLDTAQRVCDSFVVMEKGTLKAKGRLSEVLETCGATDGSLYSCIDEGESYDDE